MANFSRSRFQRHSGCFSYEVCGRKTRETGVQSMGSGLCPQMGQIVKLACGCTAKFTKYGWEAHRSCDACSDRACRSERRIESARQQMTEAVTL